VDLLFFGHGHAFKDAMRDYTTIGGAVPLMPWRSYGVWWSRYHRYSAESLVAEVLDGFTEHALPLHSVVLGESQMQPDRPPWYYLDVIACAFGHPILSHTAAAAAAAALRLGEQTLTGIRAEDTTLLRTAAGRPTRGTTGTAPSSLILWHSRR
jgi:hypothetical protein